MKLPLALFTSALLLCACPKATTGQVNPANAEARAELAAAQQKAQSGDPSAQADLQRLQQQYPNTDVAAGALFAQGELAYAQKNYAAARDSYRNLLAQYPLFPKADEARFHLGLSALQLGDYKDALDTLTPIYDRLPPDEKAAASDALSKAAVGAHDFGAAVRSLADAVARATDPAEKQRLENQLYDLVDSDVPELEIAKLAQDLTPQSPAYALVLFKLAKIDFHLHDWDALKENLTRLQTTAPQNPFSAEAQKLLDRANRREVVKPNAIGVLLPLSGKYQLFGESALAGIKLALQGSGLQLVVKDTAGEPEQAKQGVQALVLDDQVIAIIGPILSNEALAAAIDADELGVPIITLSRDESLTDRGPYVFRDMLTNSAQAKALVEYATRARGYKSFGLLYPNIPYGIELANAFWDDALAVGGEITAAETYDHDQTTFGPVIQKLVGRYYLTDRADYLVKAREINSSGKSAYAKKNAYEKLRKGLKPIVDFDALFIPDGAKNVALIAPALAVEDIITNGCDTRDIERIAKTMGLKNPKQVKTVLLMGANGWDSPTLVDPTKGAGKFADCSVFVDGFFAGSARPSTQKFVQQYEAASQKPPDLLSAYGYDAGVVVRQLVSKQKPTTRDAFRNGLGQVKNVPGAGGTVSVDGRELEHPLFFLTVEKGAVKEFDPYAETKAGG